MSESLNLEETNELAFDQSHELFIYENTDIKYELVCQLNRRHHSANITCKKTGHEDDLFEWNELKEDCFELTYGLSRILSMIPEKVAIAVNQNKKFKLNDSGADLIRPIQRLLGKYCTPVFAIKSLSITGSIAELIKQLEELKTALNSWNQSKLKEVARRVINTLDPLHAGCLFFYDFLHRQIITSILVPLIDQRQYFVSATEAFLPMAEAFHQTLPLKRQFQKFLEVFAGHELSTSEQPE
jgi:hypothetical protein